MVSAEKVAKALENAKGSGNAWKACCPAHEDAEPSLSISEQGGKIVVKCHAGCDQKVAFAAVVEKTGIPRDEFFAEKLNGTNGHRALGATTPGMRAALAIVPSARKAPEPPPPPAVDPRARPASDPVHPELGAPVALYEYADEDERFLYLSAKFCVKGKDGHPSKTFRQARPDGRGGWEWTVEGSRLVPYHLPQLIEGVAAGRDVFVVEGEKDVETLESFGYVATTNPMGAKKWRDEYTAHLKGAPVVVLPDNDKPGREHADLVANSCFAAGCRVRVVELPGLPEKGDVTDWLDAGHDLDELDTLVAAAGPWQPEGYVRERWRLDELWERDDIMRPPPPVVPYLAWGSRSTLLASMEKAGKSTLLGYVAAQVSLGGHFLGEPCRRGDVLVVGLEEFIGDAARRLRAFGADGSKVFLVDKLPSDPRERPEAVARHVAEVRPALVIVDTLMAYAEGAITDANKASEMQPLVQRLTRLAHESGGPGWPPCAVILAHHARKSDGRYRDSSAIGGAVDVIAEMFAPEEDADPSLRRVRCRGRVPSANGFEFRYDGRHILAASGRAAALDQRIVEFVRANPGCSGRAVRAAVTGRDEDINRTLLTLLEAGRLADHGRGDVKSLHVPGGRDPQSDILAPAGPGRVPEPRGNQNGNH